MIKGEVVTAPLILTFLQFGSSVASVPPVLCRISPKTGLLEADGAFAIKVATVFGWFLFLFHNSDSVVIFHPEFSTLFTTSDAISSYLSGAGAWPRIPPLLQMMLELVPLQDVAAPQP